MKESLTVSYDEGPVTLRVFTPTVFYCVANALTHPGSSGSWKRMRKRKKTRMKTQNGPMNDNHTKI